MHSFPNLPVRTIGRYTLLLCAFVANSAFAQNFSAPRALADWFEAESLRVGYPAEWSGERCEVRPDEMPGLAVCTYKIDDSWYVGAVANRTELVAFHGLVPISGESFTDHERHAMFIFSLGIWQMLPVESTYPEANEILLELYNRSFEENPARTVLGDWEFSIIETGPCPFEPALLLFANNLGVGAELAADLDYLQSMSCGLRDLDKN